jgi:hypothetical protein
MNFEPGTVIYEAEVEALGDEIGKLDEGLGLDDITEALLVLDAQTDRGDGLAVSANASIVKAEGFPHCAAAWCFGDNARATREDAIRYAIETEREWAALYLARAAIMERMLAKAEEAHK